MTLRTDERCDGSSAVAKALEAALGQIDRQFGKGSIMRLGDDGRAPVESSHGLDRADVALGIGGLPRGHRRVFSPSPRANDGRAARERAETAASPRSSTPTRSTQSTPKKLGVDTDALLVSQRTRVSRRSDHGHAIAGAIDIIVIDSVAALVPKAEIEGGWVTRVGLRRA